MSSFHQIFLILSMFVLLIAGEDQQEVAISKKIGVNGTSHLVNGTSLLPEPPLIHHHPPPPPPPLPISSSASSGGGSSSSGGGGSSGGGSSGGGPSGGSGGGSSGGGSTSSPIRPLKTVWSNPVAVMVVSLAGAIMAILGVLCCGCCGSRGICGDCAAFCGLGSTRDQKRNDYQLETDSDTDTIEELA
mmetsp:Transcript_16561/g.27460  ORF Transcript_16561/g.27460 Transcript_16561/m.27460 type:complete len:188 (+) Transcript_16561:98-661(+)|eukprot:CAMPEP_0119006320 /NCGR_PEP_ID=MMETSP1176-20130426/2231_1 /TAXON_ID=265551 /ORGANISM="Synedropsis recta cf, Strain CCMP1620" /LENGTH=187 /DNA_ID=CAMNT_0006958225 /DNA_START=74 /DNA_END=637 /DNA_ORIENTATION=+